MRERIAMWSIAVLLTGYGAAFHPMPWRAWHLLALAIAVTGLVIAVKKWSEEAE